MRRRQKKMSSQSEDARLQEAIIQQQISELQNQIMALEEKLQEFEILKESLDELQKQEGKEILVPIGNGVLMKAKIEDSNKVVVNLGANIMAEKKIEETKKLLDKQIEEIRKGSEVLQHELEKFIK